MGREICSRQAGLLGGGGGGGDDALVGLACRIRREKREVGWKGKIERVQRV